jgi:hypothetical protein
MRWTPSVRLAFVCVAFVLLALTAAVPAPLPSVPSASSIDLKVALLSQGKCGKYADGLATLMSITGFQPGSRTATTVVCLRNTAGSRGQLTLGTIDPVSRDDACSPGEAAVDSSCGQRLAGELQALLVHETAALRRCDDVPGQFTSTAFTSLGTTPLALGPIGANETRCVALRVAYPGGSANAEAAAQTDTVTWRYAFDLAQRQ